MIKMRRTLAVLMTAVLLSSLMLTGCGKSKEVVEESADTEGSVEVQEESESESEDIAVDEVQEDSEEEIVEEEASEEEAEDYSEYFKKAGVTITLPAGYAYQESEVEQECAFANETKRTLVSLTNTTTATFGGHVIFVYDAADFAELADQCSDWWSVSLSLPEDMGFGKFAETEMDGRNGYVSHGSSKSIGMDMDVYLFDTIDTYGTTILYTGYTTGDTEAEKELQEIVDSAVFTGKPEGIPDIDYYGGNGYHLVCFNQDANVRTGNGQMQIGIGDDDNQGLFILPLEGSASLKEKDVFDYMWEIFGDSDDLKVEKPSETVTEEFGRVSFSEQSASMTDLETGDVYTMLLLLTRNESRWAKQTGKGDYTCICGIYPEKDPDAGLELMLYTLCSYVPEQKAELKVFDNESAEMVEGLQEAGVDEEQLAGVQQFTSVRSYMSFLYEADAISYISEDSRYGLPTLYLGEDELPNIVVSRSDCPDAKQYVEEVTYSHAGLHKGAEVTDLEEYDIAVDGNTVYNQSCIYENKDGDIVCEIILAKNLPEEYGGVVVATGNVIYDDEDELDAVTTNAVLIIASLVMDVGYYDELFE